MQDYPGAPGTARPGNPGTAVPAACGGAAVLLLPPAWDHIRPRATPLPLAPDPTRSGATPLPQALDLTRSGAASLPQASGHVQPGAAPMALPGHADAGCGPVSAGPSVPLTTAPVPAHLGRRLRIVLRRVTATPRTLTAPLSHRLDRHSPASGHPRPPAATGGPPAGYTPATRAAYSKTPTDWSSHSTPQAVHPAVQLPTRPPPATAGTGLPRAPHSRAPPTTDEHLILPHNEIASAAPSCPRHSPSLPGRGPEGRPARLPLSKCWRGGRVMGQRRTTPGTIRAALARQWVRKAAPQPRD